MRYISAIKGAMISLVIFLAFIYGVQDSVFLPFAGVDTILTVSTFFYAVLAGFYIARLSGRYDEIRRLVADEDAAHLTLYKTSQIIDSAFAKRVSTILDAYYIVSYDHALSEYSYKQSAKYYLALWEEAKKMRTTKHQSVFQNFLSTLSQVEKDRNSVSAVAAEKLSSGQWGILLVLSGIIIVSLFNLMQPEWYSWISTALFSTVVVLVLLTIRDLQNLMIGGKSLLEESGQEVLEFLGKKRYYHVDFVRAGISTIPAFVKEARIGFHPRGSDEFEIKLVKRGGGIF